ncbi:hypothetical protein D3C72_1862320 [compost metagenome]
MLCRQKQLVCVIQSQPQGSLCIQGAMAACLQRHFFVCTTAPRAQLHQPCPIEVSLQNRHRALVHRNLFQLQRNHHVQVKVTIGVGHGFIQRDAIQRRCNITAVAAP